MSLVRGLDQDGDWLFGKSLNDYRSNKNAVEQNIKTRLSSFVGDCFFSQNSGLDWFNLLGSRNKIGLELAASAILLNTENVLQINSVEVLTDQDRVVTLKYSVNTTYGLVTGDLVEPVSSMGLLLTEDGDVLIDEDGNSLAIDDGVPTNDNLTDENGDQLTDEDDNPLALD